MSPLANYQEDNHQYDSPDHHQYQADLHPSPYPYKTAFHVDKNPWRSGRKMVLPAIKKDNFPDIVKHISTYERGRSLSVSEDLVDFGAATGGHGSFGWYSDHPVALLTSGINEGLFNK